MTPRITFMALAILAVATAAHAVDFGWQELPDGGVEYIVQIRPVQLDSFREQGFTSDIPRGADIRRIHLIVGEGQLLNHGTLPPPSSAADPMRTAAETNPSPNATQPVPSAAGNEPAAFNDPSAKPIDGPFESIFNRDSDPASSQADDKAGKQPPTASAVTPTDVPSQPKLGGDEPTGEQSTVMKVSTPESRPWMPLMLTALALFMSLGTNAYLVWIHQTLRANYRSLVARMKGDPAAT